MLYIPLNVPKPWHLPTCKNGQVRFVFIDDVRPPVWSCLARNIFAREGEWQHLYLNIDLNIIYTYICLFLFRFQKKQEIKTMSSVVASKIWNCKVFEVQFLFWCTFPPWERYLGTAHYVGSRVSLPASWLYQESCKSFTTAVRLELRLWCISHSPELKCWETFLKCAVYTIAKCLVVSKSS